MSISGRVQANERGNWPSKPLTDCLEKIQVPYKAPKKEFLSAGRFPIVSQEADFVNGYWDKEEHLVRLDGPIVLFGDHTQVLKLIDFDFVVGADGVKLLKPKKFLSAPFLRYFLESNALPSLGYARHFRHIRALPIPLPSLEDQQRIVAILDQAFAALDRSRDHAEANLVDAHELFEAAKMELLQEAGRSGRSVSFSDVVSIESSLVDPRLPENIDLPHLGAGNMVSNSDVLLNVQTAREEKLKSGKHTFEPGMVLYSKIRPYLRKAARPDFAGLCSADVYPLSPSTQLDRDFLFHLLLGQDFTEYAISGSDRAGMPKVNRAHLFRYSFNLPPLETQKELARKIDAVMETTSELASQYQAKLSDIVTLRQSLLQQAFSGQLT